MSMILKWFNEPNLSRTHRGRNDDNFSLRLYHHDLFPRSCHLSLTSSSSTDSQCMTCHKQGIWLWWQRMIVSYIEYVLLIKIRSCLSMATMCATGVIISKSRSFSDSIDYREVLNMTPHSEPPLIYMCAQRTRDVVYSASSTFRYCFWTVSIQRLMLVSHARSLIKSRPSAILIPQL